mgnify:FL=1
MKKFQIIIPLMFFFSGFSQNATESIIRGNQYYRNGQFDEAEKQYRAALEYNPKHERAKYNLANALQKQKRFTEAILLLEEFAATTDDKALQSAAYYNQGVANSTVKNLDLSIESYKKALRLNPNDKEARENLEKALLEKKRQEKQKSQSKSQSSMSQSQAEQKLKMLNQKERELQKKKNKQQGGSGQAQDW